MNATHAHRVAMSRYYAWHSRIYDATRWAFLFDRDAILRDLHLQQGQTVVEVGCGTGRNLEGVARRVGPGGEIIAVDCARPMLDRCSERMRKKGFTNVRLIDREYGYAPVTGGSADVVLMSYSLSMIPAWDTALKCAFRELRPGGRIGVVDFCLEERYDSSGGLCALDGRQSRHAGSPIQGNPQFNIPSPELRHPEGIRRALVVLPVRRRTCLTTPRTRAGARDRQSMARRSGHSNACALRWQLSEFLNTSQTTWSLLRSKGR